jgi:hypothetical protein
MAGEIPAESDVSAMDGAYADAKLWGESVVAALNQTRPEWTALFLDDAYGPVQLHADNAPRRSTLRNWYERRLAKLGDLLKGLIAI